VICRSCNRPVPRADARFCGKCGAHLPPVSKVWSEMKRAGRATLVICAVALVAGAVLFAIGKLKLPEEPSPVSSPASSPASRAVAANPPPAPTAVNIMSQATTALEVSGASAGFEGNWGGYTSGSVYAPSGDLVDSIGTAPESSTFEVRNGTVVIRFTVSANPEVSVVGSPRAWAPSSDEIVLRIELATFERHNVEISHYKLEEGHVVFTDEAAIHDAHSGDLIATTKSSAVFHKLEGKVGESWERARAEWEARHHTVDIGNFESPAEKAANE
jgi:hypothetical protein